LCRRPAVLVSGRDSIRTCIRIAELAALSPCKIIVTTTLQDLESGAGQAVTAGGTLLPMRDLIRMASHAYHYLTVFDKHTNCALYLGRTHRVASPAQRIVLHARDRGCTRPGCTASGYRCHVHHAVTDWAVGGQTNIDELALACPPDNRMVKPGGWTTRKRKDGRTEWIPPPHLDSRARTGLPRCGRSRPARPPSHHSCGQSRVNEYHHRENLLMPKEDDEDD
jgi:hypothetical protein